VHARLSDPDLLRIQEFADLVAASARSARQHERVARAAGVPVTGASLEALRTVARHGPITVGEVARRLRVGQSTASRQLRPLEEKRLVARSADPADARFAHLSATEEGRAVLARVREVSLNDFDVALGGFTLEERRRLAELLERFRNALLEARTDARGWSVREEPGIS
jgi:DNA-binding MarR family transcriptional regulator